MKQIMKAFLRTILCAGVVFAGSWAFGQAPLRNLTVDGVTYYDVHFGEKHRDSVDIFHSTGARSIPLEKLPPEMQKQLGYRPKKAAQRPAVVPKPATPKPVAQKPPPQEPAVQEPVAQKTPVPKVPVQKIDVKKSPAKEAAVPKPAVQPAAQKPQVKKARRQKAAVRRPEEVSDKREAEQWLMENEKKVWVEVWSNYDDAARQANDNYDATSDAERWRDYQEGLWSQYNEDLRKELGITQAMLRGLIEKGYREDWPVEKSPEDKVRIANDAGVKPVSDETDSSIAEVVSYLKHKLGDSRAVEYIRWYPPLLEEAKEGYSWAVEVKYRSINADGNPAVVTGTAHIRHNKVVDFKVRPRK